MKPLVSIIIPTYNRKKYVSNSIDSALNQNYINKEIIVVDDCSTDDTYIYLKNKYHDLIKLIKHDINMGVQNARNTAFDYCNGKYIAFLDDDDVWSKNNKICKQVEIFENDKEKKYGIVTTNVKIIEKNKEYKKIIKKPNKLIEHILKRNGIIYGSAALLRSDVFKEVGKFAPELPKGTDSDVFRRIILNGYDVYFIDEDMIDYHYDRGDNMTVMDMKGINRSIISEKYKLNKYEKYYKEYPKSKSYVYYKLGRAYQQKYEKQKCKRDKKLSIENYINGIVNDVLNYKCYFRIVQITLH